MNAIKRFFGVLGKKLAAVFGAIWRFIKRHKRLSIFVLVLAILGIAALIILRRLPSSNATTSFSMPETTRLAKMDIELSITATGTLQSAKAQEVSSDLAYKIAEINVEVGDVVQAGQTLCVLDAEELDELIADLREDISDAEEQDEKSLSRLETTLRDAIAKREENWVANDASVKEAYDAIEQARQTAAKQAGSSALEAQAERDAKAAAETAISKAANNTLADAEVAGQTPEQALATAQRLASDAQLTLNAANAADAGFADILDNYNKTQDLLSRAQQQRQEVYDESYNAEYQASKTRNYDAVYTPAYNTAYTNSNTSAEAAAYEKAVAARDNAYSNDTKSIETAQDNYDTQAEKDSAEALREQLKDYQEQKAELTITAPISGTVTAMTAEVGKSAGGSAAGSGASGTGGSASVLFTIQDADNLEVEVSVAEYDAIEISKGLAAVVTSDAVEDAEWDATVIAVSPTASSGYFTVTVALTSPVDQLSIGMSATVDIITQSRQDVYAVPYDAVVTNDAGQTVVYALDMGGMGAMDSMGTFANGAQLPEDRANFEDGTNMSETLEQQRTEIVVETGLETDYYIEISGEDLHEGMMILNDPLGLNTQSAQTLEGGMGAGGTGAVDGVFIGGGMPGGGGMPDGGGMPGGDTGGRMPTG